MHTAKQHGAMEAWNLISAQITQAIEARRKGRRTVVSRNVYPKAMLSDRLQRKLQSIFSLYSVYHGKGSLTDISPHILLILSL